MVEQMDLAWFFARLDLALVRLFQWDFDQLSSEQSEVTHDPKCRVFWEKYITSV